MDDITPAQDFANCDKEHSECLRVVRAMEDDLTLAKEALAEATRARDASYRRLKYVVENEGNEDAIPPKPNNSVGGTLDRDQHPPFQPFPGKEHQPQEAGDGDTC
ncbi:MAG: hypothetical protein AAF583_01560 [Pseudomonadota bacterium]